jgi:hypothetical protein
MSILSHGLNPTLNNNMFEKSQQEAGSITPVILATWETEIRRIVV